MHDLAEASARATRIAVLSRGKVVALGAASEVARGEAFAALSEEPPDDRRRE
jgi:ABC-type hemin transport system ATPase subunit